MNTATFVVSLLAGSIGTGVVAGLASKGFRKTAIAIIVVSVGAAVTVYITK